MEQKTPNAIPKTFIESAHLLAVVEQNIFQMWVADIFAPLFLKVDYMTYVEVKLFFDEQLRESGEGYYPVVNPSYGMVPIKETFFLNANGCWIQQNTHILGNNQVDKLFACSMEKYIAIQGLYNGKELLDLLNSRVPDATSMSDAKGHTIKNNLGIQLYSVVKPTCITTDKWTLNW